MSIGIIALKQSIDREKHSATIDRWLSLCAEPCPGVEWQPLVNDLRLEKHRLDCEFRKYEERENDAA